MRALKLYVSLAVVATMLIGCFACLGFTASAAEEPEIVQDGLVAWYDGSNNSNGYQDSNTTIWRDLTGNRNHFNVRVNETNYWKENAFRIDSASYYFPEALVDVINGEAYTIEFSAGELDLKATDWITLMCSDNDEFSLFIRVPQEDDDRDELEYKYNDKNQDRPKVDDGAAALESSGIGSTISITFDMNAAEGPVCIIYINGTEAGGGSVRIHVPEIQQKMFSVLGMSKEEYELKFGFLLEAYRYGAPPHAGLAFGLDRLVSLLLGIEDIRDVIAFPKVQNASELMTGCPAIADTKALDELGIQVTEEEE